MKASLKILIGVFLFVGNHLLNAQYDAMFTQYMFNEVFINPAYTGSKEAMNATVLHRQQWLNIPGRPITTTFSLHGPLKKYKMGVGINFLSEKIGVLTRNLIYGSYAYKLPVNEKSTLALGLMGGVENQMNKFASLKVNYDNNSPADPQFVQNTPNTFAPNFGFGLYYYTKKLYAGLSVPRLIDNSVKFSTGGATVETSRLAASKFTYYFTAGYLFEIKPDLKVKANGMLKAVQNAPAQMDIGLNVLMQETLWAGASYRSNSSVSVLLGYQATPQFLVCYSYDYGLTNLQRYSQGTHEIVINYLFSFTNKNIVTPRYF